MEAESLEQTIIHLENISDHEIFAHSLILVQGLVSEFVASDELLVHRWRNGVNLVSTRVRVRSGRFSIVLELNEGENEFHFSIDECVCRRTIFYRPAGTDYVIMPILIRFNVTSSGHNVEKYANSFTYDSDLSEISDKIMLGCRLIQMVIAETLRISGFGRKTFALERLNDANGNDCGITVFDSELSLYPTAEMTSEKLWEHLGREIMTSSLGHKNRKFLAFLSNVSGDDGKNEYLQPLAIGGGGLALCDAEYLRSWPATLHDFNSSFDSNNNTRSSPIENSAFSVSLGAVCHELCHMFDLGHTVNGIMGRDFYRVGRLFRPDIEPLLSDVAANPANFSCNHYNNESLIVCEGTMHRELNINFSVTSRLDDNYSHCDEKEVSTHEKNSKKPLRSCMSSRREFWFAGCATLLAYHRWINHGRNDTGDDHKMSINFLHYDHIRCIVTSLYGIVVIQLRDSNGYILKYWEFCEKRRKKLFLVPICHVRRSSSIVIEDIKGNLLKQDLESIL